MGGASQIEGEEPTSGARSDCGRLKNSPLVSSQLACPAHCRHWEMKVMCALSRFKLTSNRVLNMVYLPVGVRRHYPDGEANRTQLGILKLRMLVEELGLDFLDRLLQFKFVLSIISSPTSFPRCLPLSFTSHRLHLRRPYLTAFSLIVSNYTPCCPHLIILNSMS